MTDAPKPKRGGWGKNHRPPTGPGWGGPAKGPGKKPGEAGHGPGRPEGLANGQGKRALAQAALEDAAQLAVQTVIDIASNLDDQRALSAAMHILNRTLGETTKPTTVSGPDGGPLEIVRRIIGPTAD